MVPQHWHLMRQAFPEDIWPLAIPGGMASSNERRNSASPAEESVPLIPERKKPF